MSNGWNLCGRVGPRALTLASLLVVAHPASAESAAPGAARRAVPKQETKPSVDRLKPALPASSAAQVLGDTFVTVAEKVSASVVQIDVATRASAGVVVGDGTADRAMPHRRGTGSGIVIAASGAILTNDHVIDNAEGITVRFADGRQLPATIAGRDPEADLAVLRVDARDLVPVKFADSDTARVGEWVVAIGSPYGFGHSVTAGVLSAKGRGGLGATAEEDFLQTDASIHPGNSGGPLVRLDGQVVGINTMIVGQGVSGSVGFAVPSNLARRVADKLLAHGKVARPFVGMHLQEVTPELADELGVPAGAGALVSSVAAGGPAEKGNVKAGDVILEAGGKPVVSAHDLVRDLLAHEPSTEVPFVVVRAGKRYQTKVALVARHESAHVRIAAPPPRTTSGLGLVLRDRVEPSGLVGSFVVDVVPGSSADRAGLRAGDLVVEADGKSEPDNAAMTEAARDGRLLVRVRRGERQFFAALRREAVKR